MRRVWIGTSWKMNKTLGEAMDFADVLVGAEGSIAASIQPFVIPPFTLVREVKARLAATRVLVGAQNMHWEDKGAWTGEVSPPMLRDCGADLVELGHSERRTHFGETDHAVGLKVAAALRHGLIPLVCIGETLSERDSGAAETVLARQVAGALEMVRGADGVRSVLFAYEPVWSIGEKGVPASAGYAERQHAFIKRVAQKVTGTVPPVLYGGSVNAMNAADLLSRDHIDGLFIGRSAWDPLGYLDILDRAAPTARPPEGKGAMP